MRILRGKLAMQNLQKQTKNPLEALYWHLPQNPSHHILQKVGRKMQVFYGRGLAYVLNGIKPANSVKMILGVVRS
jgi:hypothetical protein